MGLSTDQKKAMQAIEAGENIFLTGEAGSGKTYLITEFLSRTKKKVLIAASTGVAAVAVEGVTLHSLFKLSLGPLDPTAAKVIKSLEKSEVLIIDEISMCRVDVFERISHSIKISNPELQIIAVGDFLQLPPVVKDSEKNALVALGFKGFNAFDAPMWQKLGMKTIILKQQQRQKNSDLIRSLNQIRVGEPDGIEYFNTHAQKTNPSFTTICTTNKSVELINSNRLQQLKGDKKIFFASVHGKFRKTDAPVPEVLELKIGARVMLCKNNPEMGFVNGTTATLTDVIMDEVICELDSGLSIVIKKEEWQAHEYTVKKGEVVKEAIGSFTQYPLKLAYAITIHKAQGQSHNKLNINLGRGCFAAGQLYVALSRLTSIKHFCLESPIKETDLITDQSVIDFLQIPPSTPTIEKRGGKRKGAGRKGKWKQGTELKTIRIPKDLAEEVMQYALTRHNMKNT